MSIQERLRGDFASSLKILHEQGYTLFATEETAAFLEAENIPTTLLHFDESGQFPRVSDKLSAQEIGTPPCLHYLSCHSRRTTWIALVLHSAS